MTRRPSVRRGLGSGRAPRGRPRAWLTGLALAISLVTSASGPAALAAWPKADPGATNPPEVTLPIDPAAIVQITVEGLTQDGVPYSQDGYGVVVDPAGLILTPANLVAPYADGVAARYLDWNLPASVSEISVIFSATAAGPAREPSRGRVLAVDGILDLAVVGLDPAPTDALAAVAISSATPAIGDPVIVIDAGAFATGNPSITAAEASIVEQSTRRRIPDVDPSWQSTDLVPPQEHWAGQFLVTDGEGRIVSWVAYNPALSPPSTIWGFVTSLIQPVVDAAKSGAEYTSPYVVPGTGEETYTDRGWFASDSPCDDPDEAALETFPAGTPQIAAAFDAAGMTEGEDVGYVWWDPVEGLIDALDAYLWSGGPDGCTWFGLQSGGLEALPNREYALSVFVGGTLRQVALVRTEIKADQPAGSVNVVGRVLDADTGEPIEFAFVTILQPGVDIGAWFDNPDETQVASTAITDADGAYSTEPPVAPGVYGLVIQAFGYQPIGGSLDLTEGGFLPDIALAPLE